MAISVVATGSADIATNRTTTVTFSSYTPAANDVVLLWTKNPTNGLVVTVPSGWATCDPAGGNTNVTSDSHTATAVYHLVTSGEASANTVTYAATNLWNAASNQAVAAIVLRGVDPTTPIDSSAAAFDSGNSVTPHVLPALTGANLSSNSMVVGCVAKDTNGTYTVAPTGWTIRATANGGTTTTGAAILTRDTLTTAGVNVAATNVTPSAGDEYVSYTIAFTEAASGPPPVDATDLAGITDSLTKEAGRTATDAAGISDSLAKDVGRTTADPLGVTDTLSLGFNPSAVDTVGATDSVSTTQDWVRTQPDAVGISDALAAAVDFTRSASDAVGATDTAAFRTDFANASADTTAVSDTLDVVAAYDRSATEAVAVTDSAAFTVAAAGDISAIDQVGVTDSADVVADTIQGFTDPVAVTDALLINLGRTKSDPVGISDTLAIIAAYEQSWTDPVGVADSATFTLSAASTIDASDPLAVTDTADFAADFAQTLQDPINLTDNFTLAWEQAWTDPLGVTDTATFTLGDNLVAFTDLTGVTDTFTAAVFTAPTADNTWVVRAETATHAVKTETTAAILTESAGTAARPETNAYAVKAETTMLEVTQ